MCICVCSWSIKNKAGEVSKGQIIRVLMRHTRKPAQVNKRQRKHLYTKGYYRSGHLKMRTEFISR